VLEDRSQIEVNIEWLSATSNARQRPTWRYSSNDTWSELRSGKEGSTWAAIPLMPVSTVNASERQRPDLDVRRYSVRIGGRAFKSISEAGKDVEVLESLVKRRIEYKLH
jgi:hypothetical protein